jgi:hypothetical protein
MPPLLGEVKEKEESYVQLALRPWSASADLMTDPASVTRTNRILIGTVAALSASVIAVSPAAQTSASIVVHQAQQRAVQLVAEVTDSPIAVYGDLVNDTVYNVGTLLKQYAASPFPILSAIVENQVGYLKRISDLSSASTAFQTWWNTGTRESPAGKALLASVQSALSTGDLGLAYDNFNKLTLFGIQNTVLPWLNGWLFSSTTTMGVPQQMVQNVSNALGSFLTTGTLVFGAFQSVYAPVSGAAFELSRALASVGSTLAKGNAVGAVTALVNTPGTVLNAFLNGFDYSDTTNPWAGLLSPKDPACTGRCAGGGPISQFFITIAQKVATAIKNVTPTTTSAAASLVSAPLGVSATSYTLSLDSATTSSATDTAAASEATTTSSGSKETDTADAAKVPAAGATKAEDTTSATAVSTDGAVAKAADSAAAKAADTTSAAGTTKSEDSTASASNATNTEAGSSTTSSTSDSSAKSGSAKHGSAKSGSAKSGSAKHGSAKHGSAKHRSSSSS